MEALIDNIVSNTWLFMFVLIITMGLAGFFFFAQPASRKWINAAWGTLLSIIFLFMLIGATRGSFGYAVGFYGMHTNGEQLSLIEQHEVGDGDGGSSTVYRLYVLDLKTGKRMLRMLLDYPEIITMTKDGIVVFEQSRTVKLNIITGDEMKTWSQEKGLEKFPELKTGISNIGRETKIIDGKRKGYLTITALDGHEYYFDLQDETLHTGRVPHESSDNNITFRFNTVAGRIERLVSTSREPYQESEYESDLLEPEIIANDPTRKIVIVKHFTTLEKNNAIITCLSYDLKPLWLIDQSTLKIEHYYPENSKAGAALYDAQNIVMTFGGTAICFDVTNGEERWRNTL
jgi:hypothetical protein